MKKLGIIALVGVGLIVLVQALPTLAGLGWSITMIVNGELALGFVQLIWSLAVFGAMLLAAAFLIRNRHSLADRWFSDEDIPHALSEQGLLRVAIAVTGLFFIAAAIPDLIGILAGYATERLSEPPGMELTTTPESTYQLVSGLFIGVSGLAVGTFLVGRNANLADRIWNSRPTQPRDPRRDAERACCPSCGAAYDPDDYADLSTGQCAACHSPLGCVDL